MWMHLCSRAFIAGTNQSIPKVDERHDASGCLSVVIREDHDIRNSRFVDINNGALQKLLHQQMLKTTSQLGAVYRPRLRNIYLYGYPLFYNCVSTSIQDEHLRSLDTNDTILHQTLLAEDVNQVPNLDHGSSQLLFQSDNFPTSDLVTISELEVFTTLHKPPEELGGMNNLNFTDIRNINCVSLDENQCSCSLCLRKKNAIRSSVSKAKRFIDEAVRSLGVFPSPVHVANSRLESENFYFINLAHLLFVIACLRAFL